MERLTTVLTVLCLLGCVAPIDMDPIPIDIDRCRVGLYWADCGGPGPPVAACSETTGECRWFVGGIVAGGHVSSACPPEDLCCEHIAVGTGRWPFGAWIPEADVLSGTTTVDILAHDLLTMTSPDGMPVTLDHVDRATSVEVTCEDESVLIAPCRLESVSARLVGESLVLRFVSDSLGILRRSYTMEVWRAPDGLSARFYYRDEGPSDAPVGAYCGRTTQAYVPLDGTVRLSPDAFERPEAIHGVVDANFVEPERTVHYRIEF